MSLDSLSFDSFQSGHDVDAYSVSNPGAYLTSINENAKQPLLDDIHQFRYNPHLGLEEFSQSSSEDSCSQSSESTLPTSPLSHSSDEFGDKTYQDVADLTLSSRSGDSSTSPLQPSSQQRTKTTAQQRTRGDLQPFHSRRGLHTASSLSSPQPSIQSNATSDVELSTVPSQNATPTPAQIALTSRRQAKAVPFRPKLNSTGIAKASCLSSSSLASMVDAPPAITLDTSRVACDAQRSRARVEPSIPSEFEVCRRRGRSIGSSAGPPKLRRDTDHTDAIVKMIVLFCVNLINSIWSPTGACRDDTTASQPGANVLPLQVFITETLRRSKTSYSTLQIALYYLILLKQCLPQYGSAGQQASGCRAMQCGRRMFLTALILASKYLQDRNYSARAWSKISGLPLKEINENERRYLNIVRWDLHVPKDTFENWSKIVLNVCRHSMDPEVCRSGQDSQGPPRTGPSGQACFLQNMSRENLVALRNWWLCNLRGLSTDIIRCPRKTDSYVSSIMPFRDMPYLPKPIFDTAMTEDFMGSPSGQDTPRPVDCLPKLPSIDRISKYFISNEQANSPAATVAMPPPPMLANLPTPQTTPRTDMSRMWTPQLGKPSLRCRASASALANLDRSRCPMANLETCPPPKPRSCAQQQQPSWRDYESVPVQHLPDRSLTSSPESVVSDVFSMPARSRSSSISSTSSWMASGSVSNMLNDKERSDRLSQQLSSVQQQFSQQCMSQVAGQRQQSVPPRRPTLSALQTIDRPKTAFKVTGESQRLSATIAERWIDEGYGSDDTKHERDAMDRETTAHILAELQATQWGQKASTRPSLQRTMTQVQQHPQQDNKNQVLKRSRSESLDMSQDKTPVPSQFQTFIEEQSKLARSTQGSPINILNWYSHAMHASCDAESTDKEMQQPNQLHLPPRMPVQLATQKRLALQVSPAARLASDHLKRDAALGRLGSVY